MGFLSILGIVFCLVNAIMGFTGFGLNRVSSGLGWILAAFSLIILYTTRN